MPQNTPVRVSVYPISAVRHTELARLAARHGVLIDDYRSDEDGTRSARMTFPADYGNERVSALLAELPD